jgi:plastocyanin
MSRTSLAIGGCLLLCSLAAPGLLLAAEDRGVVPVAAQLASPQPREDVAPGGGKAVELAKRSISRGKKTLERAEKLAPRRKEAAEAIPPRDRPSRGETSADGPGAPAAAPAPTPETTATAGDQQVAAASASVTIVDFDYSPAEVTVNAGESVTWTNSGDEPHTATADSGAFDTPVLNSGESASVTLSQPGTFSYFCKLHPPEDFPGFTGTIEVVSSEGEAGDGDTGGGDTGGDDTGFGTGAVDAGAGDATVGGTGAVGSSGAAGTGGGLPFTGHETVWLALVGAGLLTLGGAVQRRSDQSL